MKALISLELRKQSKSFFGLLFIIAISLTLVTASISTFANLGGAQAFLLVTAVLQAFGLPFFALLLGASAGAALKSSVRNAEEDIPVRPSKRTFAAYIASLVYFLMLAGIIFVIKASINDSDILKEDFLISIGMVLLVPLHTAAFIFSYWLSQALLGGVISTIITIPAYFFYPFWIMNSIDYTLTLAPGLIAASIQLYLMSWLANRIERDKRIRFSIKMSIGVVLVCSTLLASAGISLLSLAYQQLFEPRCGCSSTYYE
jgi:hypothetical protein